MPFTLSPNQFTSGEHGSFKASLFPDGDIEQRLNAWINQATTKVADLDATVQERAAIAYVNWKGWEFVSQEKTDTPESVHLDSGRTAITFNASQRSYFTSRANQAKAIYDEYFTFEEDFIIA